MNYFKIFYAYFTSVKGNEFPYLFPLQQGIIEILFDLFRLPIPDWTPDFLAALLSIGIL